MVERSGVPVGGLSFWDIRQIIKFHGARSLEAKQSHWNSGWSFGSLRVLRSQNSRRVLINNPRSPLGSPEDLNL